MHLIRLLRLLLVCVWIGLCASAAHVEADAPTHAVDGKFIKEWLLLGPFLSNDLDTDFLALAGGEANINPKEGDTVTGPDGHRFTWTRYASPIDRIKLQEVFENLADVTAYAFCTISTHAASDVEFQFRHRNAAKVWLEGQLVYQERASQPTRQIVKANSFIPDPGILKRRNNRCLVKLTRIDFVWDFLMQTFPPNRATIEGEVLDETGAISVDTMVQLEQNGQQIAGIQTDPSGRFRLSLYPAAGIYDLSATSAESESGDWRLGIQLGEGSRRKLTLTLQPAISLAGMLLMLDGETPHASVPVQAVKMSNSAPEQMGEEGNYKGSVEGDLAGQNRDSAFQALEVVATTVSDKRGAYRLINLRPGEYQVRCQTPTGYIYYGDRSWRPQRKLQPRQPISFKVEKGSAHRNVDFQFAAFKKGRWKYYTTFDGLPHLRINAIHQTPTGLMWFGIGDGGARSGVCYYDGEVFQTLPLVGIDGPVNVIHQTPDGTLWLGMRSGVYRIPPDKLGLMDEVELIPVLTTKNIMTNEVGVTSIDSTPDGTLWVALYEEGLYRYDGQNWVNFTRNDGLSSNYLMALRCTSEGIVWCGTNIGISRYDGKQFINFSRSDGLGGNMIHDIYQSADGALWFATHGGVSRHDETADHEDALFQNFTTKDGLGTSAI